MPHPLLPSLTTTPIIYTAEENALINSLILATQENNLPLVRSLIHEQNAPVNGSSLSNGGLTALMIASQYGHLEIVKELLIAGADPNASRTDDGATALMLASLQGYLEVVQELLKAGANPNAATIEVGETSLMYSSQNGRLDITHELLMRGANPNASTNDGTTSLMYATFNNHLEMVQTLLKRGANPNAATKYTKKTALIVASQYGYIPIAASLIQNGAYVKMQDSFGKEALDYAGNNPLLRAAIMAKMAVLGGRRRYTRHKKSRTRKYKKRYLKYPKTS